MADRRITVTISAKDSFSSVMNQYNTKMGQAATATKQVEESTGKLENGFRRMQQAFDLGIAGAMLNQVKGLAEEWNAVGIQVHANTVLFTQLTSDIGGSTMVLESLRRATNGVVTDMNLMAGASQLLRLNIVDNNDDLAHLYGNIQKLKDPTESTTDAIKNFALMLSNESLLRLDSFGISSANVKRRMDELGQSFREAVMAEMDTQVERLGDAADVASTAFGRLQVKIENVINRLKEGFAISVETASAVVEGLQKQSDRNFQTVLAARQMFGAPTFGDQLANFDRGGYTESQWAQAARMIERANNDSMRQGSMAGLSTMFALQRQQQEQLARQIEENQSRFAAMLGMGNEPGYTPQMHFNTDWAMGALDKLRSDVSQHTMIGGMQLFTEAEATRAQNIADTMSRWVDDVKLFKDTDLIPEDIVNRVQSLADEAADFAKEAQKGADAFNSLKLSDVFGQTSGGMLGDVTDQILSAAQAQGWSADQIDALRSKLDLASGRETALSTEFQDQVIPAILGLPTPEQMTEAASNYVASLREAVIQGVNPAQLQGNQTTLAGIFGGQFLQGYDASSYMQSLQGMFASTVPPEDFPATWGIDPFGISSMTTDSQTVTDNLANGALSLSDMLNDGSALSDKFVDIGGTIDTIFSKTYKFKVEVIAPDWVKAMMDGSAGDAFAAQMAAATTANGGTPPGQQPAAGSGRVSLR